MWEEIERSPALAAPGSNNTRSNCKINQSIRWSPSSNRQVLSEKEEADLAKIPAIGSESGGSL